MAITYSAPTPEEAHAFCDMLCAIDSETKFMLYEPGERAACGFDARRAEGMIRAILDGGFLLVARNGETMCGYIMAQRGSLARVKHTAYIVIGIRAAFRGQGVGTELMRRLDEWARINGVKRLELTVMCTNSAARRLYEKQGFEVEGVRRASMLVDGEYVDEWHMAKLL